MSNLSSEFSCSLFPYCGPSEAGPGCYSSPWILCVCSLFWPGVFPFACWECSQALQNPDQNAGSLTAGKADSDRLGQSGFSCCTSFSLSSQSAGMCNKRLAQCLWAQSWAFSTNLWTGSGAFSACAWGYSFGLKHTFVTRRSSAGQPGSAQVL